MCLYRIPDHRLSVSQETVAEAALGDVSEVVKKTFKAEEKTSAVEEKASAVEEKASAVEEKASAVEED
ncbi:hypothetical protein DPV78_010806 [Talaromyces pinophilus]|nr:hypothetical protein DPV78_010806 [Talaromyces pinophilus]